MSTLIVYGRSMGFLSWKFLLVLICIPVVNAGGCLAQNKNEQTTGRKNSAITNKDYSDLFSKAQAAGSVRIIARLNMPFVPEGQLPTSQAAVEQQVRISRLQEQLCEALSKYNVKRIKRFKYIPYIAMEVDSEALRALISSPLVVSVEEDKPVPPTFNQVDDPGFSQTSFVALGGCAQARI